MNKRSNMEGKMNQKQRQLFNKARSAIIKELQVLERKRGQAIVLSAMRKRLQILQLEKLASREIRKHEKLLNEIKRKAGL